MRYSALTPDQWPVAEVILRNIDEFGYLKVSVQELSSLSEVSQDKCMETLKIFQMFRPAGIAARDLRECLMLQLERLDRARSIEYRIVRDCMDSLSKRNLLQIAQTLGTSVEEVQNAVKRIMELSPRPFQPGDQ